jgi:gas vesicle protein
MNNTGKIVVAVAAGIAVGAISGVLFAPGKGSETRKKINEQGEKFAGDLKDTIRKGKEKFNDLKEGIEEKLKEKTEEFA